MPREVTLLASSLRRLCLIVPSTGLELPHVFSEGDIRFISTLAGLAALAAANTHLFLNVEVGRRQLEAILNSSPDPVLVTDPNDRLILANTTAVQALGYKLKAGEEKPIGQVIPQKPLLELLRSTGEKQSVEILLPIRH